MTKENQISTEHIDDVLQALGRDDISSEQIEKEMSTYMNVYGVPLGTAKRSIVKKYDGDPSSLYQSTVKKIDKIQPNEENISVKGKIISLHHKTYENDDGEQRYSHGIVGDDSGTMPFTSWKPLDFFEKGDTIKIEGGYSEEYNDNLSVKIPEGGGSIKKIDPDEVSTYEAESEEVDIKDIDKSTMNLDITGRVISVNEKEVDTDDGKKTIFEGIIADKTGKIQFTAWDDLGIEEDDVINIKCNSVKTFRGLCQLSIGSYDTVKTVDDEFPSADELDDINQYSLNELDKSGGAIDAKVDAVVIDIKDGSGLIWRCPECQRVTQKGKCRVHGAQPDKEEDLRIRAILDDGTGSMNITIGKEITEDILGYGLTKAVEKVRDQVSSGGNSDIIKDEIDDKLFGTGIVVQGDVRKDEYGLNMYVDEFEFSDVDIKSKAENLLNEVK